MSRDVVQAKAELELAIATAERLWAEYSEYCKTLDPGRGIVGDEELRRMREAGEWQRRVYEGEHELFRAEHGTPGIVGAHEGYQWLTLAEWNIASLLSLCPDVVVGKRIAVTCIDSGALRLSEDEKSEGWWSSEAGRVFQGTSWSPPEYRPGWNVAWSPLITSIEGLPNETHQECCAGWDEWYVFDREISVQDVESFVNWGGFRLYDDDPNFQWLLDRFWDQIARVQPESYIAEGTVFTFVTRNAVLFDRVLAALIESQRSEN